MGNSPVPLDRTSPSLPNIPAAIAGLRHLPASAPVVQKALAQFENPNFEVNDLKKTLLSDPAIAAQTLRLANSAYFGFRSEVQTVSQAIVLLGQNRIRTLLRRVLVDKLLAELARGCSAAVPLRKMSLATATACCALSQLLQRGDAEEMLLAGLLHNIGDLFLLAKFPVEYWQAIPNAAALGYQESIRAVFGMTTMEAGKRLLEAWQFPAFYGIAIEWLDDPLASACPAAFSDAIALIHCGKKLAESLISGAGVEEAIQTVPPEISERLSASPELLAEIYQNLPQRMSLEQLQAGSPKPQPQMNPNKRR